MLQPILLTSELNAEVSSPCLARIKSIFQKVLNATLNKKLMRPLHKDLFWTYLNGEFPFYELYDPQRTTVQELLTDKAYFWFPGNLWRWAFVYRANYADRINEFWADEIYDAQIKEHFHQLPRISDVPVDGTRAPVISERDVRKIHRSYLTKNKSKIIWLNIRNEFKRIHSKPSNRSK